MCTRLKSELKKEKEEKKEEEGKIAALGRKED